MDTRKEESRNTFLDKCPFLLNVIVLVLPHQLRHSWLQQLFGDPWQFGVCICKCKRPWVGSHHSDNVQSKFNSFPATVHFLK